MTRFILFVLTALPICTAVPALAEDASIDVQVVDAMSKVFGPQNGFRAVHAKGVVAEGSFRATPEAAALSKAAHFGGQTIAVTVRFSDGPGIPTIPDGSPDALPHGMALKFRLPDGSETDMVTNSLKFFPVATAEELKDLFEAIAASPSGAPQPTKLEQFIGTHPSVAAASGMVQTPQSLFEQQYNGLNAFVLVNKAGDRQAVRFRITPERTVLLTPAEAASRAPDFLMRDVSERLSRGAATFRLQAQLAQPGDQTNDPSKAWPEDRKVVDLGTITLDRAVSDSVAAEKALLFLPGQLTDGIELSADPMISIRDAAYAVSFSRRSQ